MKKAILKLYNDDGKTTGSKALGYHIAHNENIPVVEIFIGENASICIPYIDLF